ncbi:PTS system cellobiose-specific IIB component [Breznakia sp. PF5-3]|uniref:PTS sugar transporter subunit IIB n=1 Tax=unclassified Breznakia TaxID=2623764 RepID=UPI002404C76D|nr:MULTISPECIES: PTS sugar transporter subunit IIB [unclassified Breznakia]MDL2276571.1 PTS sugar transporter subunit IIB [Breznakia sp. OttesenSCG-928-G09]MDF9823859.1 PTS system cellobiose-specific IIB component [Breznakia sp. PM6-1]MDF9834575.1 PTS system cellobiose-specific IIB component [Breznakia sp. PF5-3]MDF9836808.1 PTS system cellobiose-specific IIB component [Breznakia sp. PFB2-8]MDF9858743.1 PTS system cellobiose-specific IIB component [Breznakia sp. PH5-24]
MKIVLVCNAGMSTSVLVQKMLKSAEAKGIDADIDAYSVEVLEETLNNSKVDCILVGPQIRHMMPNVEKMAAGISPVALINMRDYGTINGEAVLNQALELINK